MLFDSFQHFLLWVKPKGDLGTFIPSPSCVYSASGFEEYIVPRVATQIPPLAEDSLHIYGSAVHLDLAVKLYKDATPHLAGYISMYNYNITMPIYTDKDTDKRFFLKIESFHIQFPTLFCSFFSDYTQISLTTAVNDF